MIVLLNPRRAEHGQQRVKRKSKDEKESCSRIPYSGIHGPIGVAARTGDKMLVEPA